MSRGLARRRQLRCALIGLVLALLPVGRDARAQQVGGIRGLVVDQDFLIPVAEVQVDLLETGARALTDADGRFVFDSVPPGVYTVVLLKPGFNRRVLSGVVVSPGQLAELRVELASEVIEMDELVVRGIDLLGGTEVSLLEIRASAASLQDAVSSELISKAGASDVAGALKLVVGASVVGGKYATVRGLSDRYTGTTLNGVRVPSADPRRRAVQVDLFPTGTVESVTVSKTFTPDLQGDFTGGGVDIVTRSIPDEPILSVSVGSEFNSLATNNGEFLTYQGGGVEADASGGGDRELPAAAQESLPKALNAINFTASPSQADRDAAAAFDRLTRAFAPAMGVSRDEPGLNQSFSVTGGGSFQIGAEDRLGFLAAVTWSHKYDLYLDGENTNGIVSDPTQGVALASPRADSKGTEEVLIGGLGSLVWQPREGNELSLKVIVNRSAQDEARLQVSELGEGFLEQNQSLTYTERSLLSSQLHGRHGLGERLDLNWFVADSSTSQEEPDVRFFRNVFDLKTLGGRIPNNRTDAESTRRIFRRGEEDNLQGAVNMTVSFKQWQGVEGKFKAGVFRDAADRTFRQRSFTYRFATQFGSFFNETKRENQAKATFQAESPDQLWTDVFLDPDRIGLADNNPPAPNQLLWVLTPIRDVDVDYDGTQDIDAVYGMVELPLSRRFKAVIGARYESTDINVVPENQAFGVVEIINVTGSGDREVVDVPQAEAVAEIQDRSLLPSLGLIYEIRPEMKVRGSWSRTLARPTFRELAPVATEEFLFGDEFVGNPALTLSRITNADLRWEWFRRPGEVLAVSVFHKSLQDPIELISFGGGGRSFIQPVNFEKGSVFGVELEARTSLDVLGEPLRDLSVGLNFTYLDSQVNVPGNEQRSLESFGLDQSERPLQGQPEHIFNFNITYEHERTGITAGLFVNRIGETLLTGAARGSEDGVPNVFDDAMTTLDVTFRKKLGGHSFLSFRGRNLLRQEEKTFFRLPGGEEATKARRETASRFSLSYGWSW